MKLLFLKKKRIKIIKILKLHIALIFSIIYVFMIRNNINKLNENMFRYFQNSSKILTNNYQPKYVSIEKENRPETLLKGKKFIDKCLNKQIISQKFRIVEKPKISAIIPVYNSEKTIYPSICSIQNQNYTSYEIILINDFSSDNSSKVIQHLKEKDQRIKLINNHKNMGTLYSRNIGALMAKGEYILPLDNDDLFYLPDIFYFIIKIALKYDLDIVGFKSFRIGNYKDNINQIYDLYNYKKYLTNIIVYQPELSTWMISRKKRYQTHDVTIWAKCFKSKIYKNAVKKLAIKKYSVFISWAEDTIMNYIIFNIAGSFSFIDKFGIIHLHNKSTASFTMGYNIKLIGELLLLDIIYNFSKYNSNKVYVIMCAYNIKKVFRIRKFINNTNLVYFKSILNKIINDKYFSVKIKKKIRKDFLTFFK